MRIEQYIEMIDYFLWEVMENCNLLPKTQIVEVVKTVMPITSAEDKAHRRLQVKAMSTLMMGIPNEHQLKFNSIKHTKSLLEAIEKREDTLQENVDYQEQKPIGRGRAQEGMCLLKLLTPQLWCLVMDLEVMIRVTKLKKDLTMHLWHTPLQVLILRELRKKLEIVQREKDDIQLTVEKLENESKSLNKIIDSQTVDNYKKGLGYNVVPPPHTGESLNAKTSEDVPKVVKKDNVAPIIKDWKSDDEDESVPQPKREKKTVKPSVAKSAITIKENFKIKRPKAVVNTASPKAILNAVKASVCLVWKPKIKILDHVSKHNSASITLMKYDYIDAQADPNYKEIDGGYVAFRGNPKEGKNTGKCIIKTGELDFENVYFIKELKFNRFSISQMCDKKNIILFNDTECVVLSPDFKLTNENHVLLRVPRKNNMYSVDLKNIIPKGGLTCLFAKAISDESRLLHRRLGHLNFKTMNKLVKGNLFYEVKGIMRQYSVAKTPQQNGVAKRRNRTQIEAARTMLANSKLQTTFWAEAVSTACYVQDRVLVVKPQNKTPYALFHCRTPMLSFMRPFGCPVTILNTIDYLGKFDGMADEGFCVGYSLNSKAFRVFNSRTRIVEETLHIRFSENTPNNVGTKDNNNAGQARKEKEPFKDYILLPLWTTDLPFPQEPKSSQDAGFKPSNDVGKKVNEVPRQENECKDQHEKDRVNSTNRVNDVRSTINAASNEINDVVRKSSIELLDDLDMPELEDISIFKDSNEDVFARVISSSDDEALDKEDTSKQGRIDEIDDDDNDMAMVSTHDDRKQQQQIASSQQPQVQDKDKEKAKLIKEPEMPKKIKHQIRADKELAEKLQAEMQAKINEDNRLARERERERAQKEQEKMEDDKEFAELKQCLEILPDDGDDITIDATPLSSKSLTIVDYKIYKEGKNNYFQIFKEYDNVWKNQQGLAKVMRIEQYFLMNDYSLWEVILNGDSPIPKRIINGVVQPVAPTTAEQSLKIYEAEVKISTSTSHTTQNIAFVSSQNTDITNESVSVVASVSAASTKVYVSALPNVDTLSDQIDADDLEEIDLKWQMAMLTMRAKRFLQRTKRNRGVNGTTSIKFDMSKWECYNCDRRGHFARKCRSPKDKRSKEPQRRNVPVETSTSNSLVSQCDGVGSYDWSFQAEEEPTNYVLMAFTSSSSSSSDNEVASYSKACTKAYATMQSHYEARIILYQQNETVFEEDVKLLKLDVKHRYNALVELRKKFEKAEQERDDFNSFAFDCDEMFSFESDVSMPASPVYDRYKLGEGYHVVPPPYTGTYMTLKLDFVFHDASTVNETVLTAFNVEPSLTKPVIDLSQSNRPSAPIIEDCVSDTEDDFEADNLRKDIPKSRGHSNSRNRKACFVFLTRSRFVPLNAARPVNTIVPQTNVTRPRPTKTIFTKLHSPLIRPINHRPSPNHSTFPQKVTTVKAPQVNVVKGVKGNWDNPQHTLKDKGVIDTRCSRHMTGNMSYLFDFGEINGGYVAFGRNPKGVKITGKFDGKADEGFLVGYSEPESKVYVSLSSSAKTKKHDAKTNKEAKGKSHVEFSIGVRNLSEEFEDFSNNSTNKVNAAHTPVLVVGQTSTNSTNTFCVAGPSNTAVSPTLGKTSYVDPSQYPDDPDMPALEDITYSDDEEDVGVEADFSKLETTITVSPIPTTRVYNDHPTTQIIDGKSASTPIDTKKPLLKDLDGKDMDVYTYRSMICSLMYLTSSRLDIMFAICACAHFQVTPKASHLHAVKRNFRYLKGKPHLGLWYPKDSPFNLVAYSESDYAGASLDRKSTTKGCQFLGYRLISWQCKKQTVIATSSTKAKYVAAASCYAQVLWIQNQLLDYGYNFMHTTIYIVLRLDDAESIDCLPNEEIFAELERMGKVEALVQDKIAQAFEITKLKQRVKRLEKKNKLKVSGLKRSRKEVVAKVKKDAQVAKNDADAQGRLEESQVHVYHIDLEHAKKVLKVVTAATTTITVAPITDAPSTARRRKGVAIRDPEEIATLSTIVHFELKSKDKGKGISDGVIKQVKRKEKQDNVVLRYEALKRKPETASQARKNMMVYLKNMTGFKMDFLKVRLEVKEESEVSLELLRFTRRQQQEGYRPDFGVDVVKYFKEYTQRDYYYWLKTYYCWYKLKLLDNAADLRLRLLEESVDADEKFKGYRSAAVKGSSLVIMKKTKISHGFFDILQFGLTHGASAACTSEDFDATGVVPLSNSSNIRLNSKSISFDIVTILPA
nr:uncharacterized mitochondrial protein AtMg00810-like [Tanacetum cinerariifolium]